MLRVRFYLAATLGHSVVENRGSVKRQCAGFDDERCNALRSVNELTYWGLASDNASAHSAAMMASLTHPLDDRE